MSFFEEVEDETIEGGSTVEISSFLEKRRCELTETRVCDERIHALLRGPDQHMYLDHLSPGLQMVYATRHLENAVRRGGFESYFSRAGGHVAVKAMQGYALIGAECHAALVENALALFLGGTRSSSSYAVLDDVFTDLDPPGPLKAEYLEAHLEDFVPAS